MSRVILFVALFLSVPAPASTPIPVRILTPKLANIQGLAGQLQSYFAGERVREIRVRALNPRTLIVRLIAREVHSFETVRVGLTAAGGLNSVTRNYRPQSGESLTAITLPTCPDPGVQFISIAPNDIALEQATATEVAEAARKHNLKTVLLLGEAATRIAYLNYMACPNLVGNFYDGDANPNEILTADDSITADDFKVRLKGGFRQRVTNIWLACRAFNEPMRGAVVTDAKSQVFAAGVNDLLVGPSDRTAACAMKLSLDGQPMRAAFQSCYSKLDTPQDQWGFDQPGSETFGE